MAKKKSKEEEVIVMAKKKSSVEQLKEDIKACREEYEGALGGCLEGSIGGDVTAGAEIGDMCADGARAEALKCVTKALKAYYRRQ